MALGDFRVFGRYAPDASGSMISAISGIDIVSGQLVCWQDKENTGVWFAVMETAN